MLINVTVEIKYVDIKLQLTHCKVVFYIVTLDIKGVDIKLQLT